ncbi:MAG: ATP synthase F1 subunit gamma [Phycisphaera sp.]|nr:ATP synthase F1 subunit gamma [Phycisphaera sp.]
MARTKQIKARIKAVGNIKRITKTMQMIATARFQAAQRRATATQPYSRKITELVGELASAVGSSVSHPLLRAESKASGKRLVLVITSNRGLCGGYNAGVLRAAMAYRRDHADTALDIELVGKKGQAFLKFNRVELAKYHSQFGDKPAFEEVERLANRYMQAFGDSEYDAVDVIYTAFHSMSNQKAEVMNLLPLEPPKAEGQTRAAATTDYDFSPAPAELLNELLPITVKTRLFQAFNEATVSEQIARMVAMKSATDAAGKMGKELTRKYNRARQAAITTELTEVISGTAALE